MMLVTASRRNLDRHRCKQNAQRLLEHQNSGVEWKAALHVKSFPREQKPREFGYLTPPSVTGAGTTLERRPQNRPKCR